MSCGLGELLSCLQTIWQYSNCVIGLWAQLRVDFLKDIQLAPSLVHSTLWSDRKAGRKRWSTIYKPQSEHEMRHQWNCKVPSSNNNLPSAASTKVGLWHAAALAGHSIFTTINTVQNKICNCLLIFCIHITNMQCSKWPSRRALLGI